MRIHTKSKLLGDILWRIFKRGVKKYKLEFEFSREVGDDELLYEAFVTRSMRDFDKKVKTFRKEVKESLVTKGDV